MVDDDNEKMLRVEDLECPRCHAAAGASCVKRPSRRDGPFHDARHKAWHAWAEGYSMRQGERNRVQMERQRQALASWPKPAIGGGVRWGGWGWAGTFTVVAARHKPTNIVVATAEGRSTLKMRKNVMTMLKAVVAAVRRGGWATPLETVRTYEDNVEDLDVYLAQTPRVP